MTQAALDTIVDPARLTLLQHTELLDSPPEEAFDAPLGRGHLCPYRLGPATGRTGAYPDGTFTREVDAA